MTTAESQIEQDFIAKLGDLKYTYRQDIRDRAALEKNFREKFEALNRVHLTDGEFSRLLEEIITPSPERIPARCAHFPGRRRRRSGWSLDFPSRR